MSSSSSDSGSLDDVNSGKIKLDAGSQRVVEKEFVAVGPGIPCGFTTKIVPLCEDGVANLYTVLVQEGTTSAVDADYSCDNTSCDADTYGMVAAADLPNTLPAADTDTNFDGGSVADVRVSSVNYCKDPGTGLPDPDHTSQGPCEIEHGSGAWITNDCIQKIEFNNKKLLQNACNEVVLQEDASGGQAEDVYGLSSSPLLLPLWEIGFHAGNPTAQYNLRMYPINPAVDTFMGCMVVVPPDDGDVDSCCHLS